VMRVSRVGLAFIGKDLVSRDCRAASAVDRRLSFARTQTRLNSVSASHKEGGPVNGHDVIR
jgi:hypothetical protein